MSDNSQVQTTSSGIGLFGALFLIFLTLKLAGIAPVAAWSWLWITAPLWGGFALMLAFFAVVFTFGGIAAVLTR